MASQDIAQALLAAALAVQAGLIAPKRAAAVLAETVAVPGRGFFVLLAEWQTLDAGEVQNLQALTSNCLARYQGDPDAALRECAVDPQLRREIEQFQLPAVLAALNVTTEAESAAARGAETALGDHYVTLPSAVATGPARLEDPYTTGQFASRKPDGTQLDSLPDRAVPPPRVPESSGAKESDHLSVDPFGATEADLRIIQSNSILEIDEPADYATQPPSIPQFQTLEPATAPPGGEYETLKSGIPSSTELAGRISRDPEIYPGMLRFRVLREHAKGGLGKVSVAEDLELHREVAFKEIQRRYSDDAEARSRFLLEAEITGGLEHPGIVPVYGLGTHADGRPYYAMRFIRGRSFQQAIEQYFRRDDDAPDPATQQTEFRQLLRRFIDVCHAIDYAHNRGILHRDLKPGNIMLGDYGETLVVDWGIAKAVAVPGSLFKTTLAPLQPQAINDASQTMLGVAIGTPQFMSPEQARGLVDELGPASDIYSLGATLYCLLTGAAAFVSRDFETVLKQVKSGTFPPPLTVNAKVPKPLNAICLKAMSLKPALRYGSASALASDIEHWLADQPVQAYEENRWELLSRWVRRHQARAQAMMGSVIAIAIVSTIAALLIDQSRRAESLALEKQREANVKEIAARKDEEQAKQEALRRSRQTREAIDTLLSGVSDALDDFPGMQDARRRLLERAAADYSRLAEEKSADPQLQLEAVRSLLRLGDVQEKLNFVDLARATFRKAADHLGMPSVTNTNLRNDFELERGLARTRQGALELRAGDQAQAVNAFQEAVSTFKNVVDGTPSVGLEFQEGLGRARIGLGLALQAQGKIPMAGAQLQQTLVLFQGLRGTHPDNVRILTAAADAETAYARYLFDTAEPAAAVRVLEEAIAIHDDLVADFPDQPEYFAQRATARISLSDALRQLGEWPKVVVNDEACVADLQEVVRARPDVPRHRENLAVARLNCGQSQRKLGSNTAAVPLLQQALEDFTELSASFPLARYIEALANTRVTLAQVQSELGQQDLALELVNAAIADYRELLGLQTDADSYLEGLGIVQRQRSRILARRSDFPAAVQAIEESIKTLQAAVEKRPKIPRIKDHLAWSWTNLGQIQFTAGQTDAARTAFQTSFTLRKTLVDVINESPQFGDALAWQLATCPVENCRQIVEALELSRVTTVAFPESTQFWLTRGAALLLHHEDAQALTALQRSAKLRGREDGLTLCWLAMATSKLKQPDEAQKHLAAAKAWQQAQKPADEELTYWIKQAEQTVGMK